MLPPNRPNGPNDEAPNENDIDLDRLVGVHQKRSNARKKIYEDIYLGCCKKIELTNDILKARTCKFHVPYARFGLPLYHVNACSTYLLLRLHDQGFQIKFVPPNQLYISWERIVKERLSLTTKTFKLDTSMDSSVPKLKYIPPKGYNLPSYPSGQFRGRNTWNGFNGTSAYPPTLPPSMGNHYYSGSSSTKMQRLLDHKGCGGDCCKNDSKKAKRTSRRARLEMERQVQQDQIANLISRKDRYR